MVVADVNVFVRGALGHPQGPNARILEAAAAGVFVLVTSHQIRKETIDVLCREDVGPLEEDEATAVMEAICEYARIIEPGPEDPAYRRAIRDPDDVIVLRTAAGVYFHDDLAQMIRRAIVSGDTHAFPVGRGWYGFKYFEAADFWRTLSSDG